MLKKLGILMLAIALVFGLVLSCGGDSGKKDTGLTDEQKDAIQDAILDLSAEELEELIDAINEEFGTTFAADPNDWSKSDWDEFFELYEKNKDFFEDKIEVSDPGDNWTHNLGAPEIELADNFQYGDGYQAYFEVAALFNGKKVEKNDVYTLKAKFTVSRDLEGLLLAGLVDRNPVGFNTKPNGSKSDYHTVLTYIQGNDPADGPKNATTIAAGDAADVADGAAIIGPDAETILKAGETYEIEVKFTALVSSSGTGATNNTLCFQTRGEGTKPTTGSGVKGAVTLKFTEFLWTKGEGSAEPPPPPPPPPEVPEGASGIGDFAYVAGTGDADGAESQVRWNVNTALLDGAKYLVIETTNAFAGGAVLIWQPEGDDWGWNEVTVVGNSADAETGVEFLTEDKKGLKIDLSAVAPDFMEHVEGGTVTRYRVHLAYYTGATKAHTLGVTVGYLVYENVTVTFNWDWAEAEENELPTSRLVKKDGSLGAYFPELGEVVRDGWKFNNWWTAATGGEAVNATTTFDEDTEIFARWIQLFTVTFYDGTKVMEDPAPLLNVEAGSLVEEPETPVKDDHSFGGWYKDDAFLTAWDFENDTVTGNINIYAKFEELSADSRTVTFVVYGGTAVQQQVIELGEKAKEPTAPTHTNGATFGGWYTTATFATAYDFDTPVTENISLYAKWNVTVKFNTNGGSAVADIPGILNRPISAPTAPNKDYFEFVNWYKEAALTNQWNFATNIAAADVSGGIFNLYAKWTFEGGEAEVVGDTIVHNYPLMEIKTTAPYAEGDAVLNADGSVTFQAGSGNGQAAAAILYEFPATYKDYDYVDVEWTFIGSEQGVGGTNMPGFKLMTYGTNADYPQETSGAYPDADEEEITLLVSASNNTDGFAMAYNNYWSPSGPANNPKQEYFTIQITKITFRKGTRHTVTLDVNGGNTLSQTEIKILSGTALADNYVLGTLPTPTHDTLNFQGWFVGTDDSGVPVPATITADTTLVAKWDSTVDPLVVWTDFKGRFFSGVWGFNASENITPAADGLEVNLVGGAVKFDVDAVREYVGVDPWTDSGNPYMVKLIFTITTVGSTLDTQHAGSGHTTEVLYTNHSTSDGDNPWIRLTDGGDPPNNTGYFKIIDILIAEVEGWPDNVDAVASLKSIFNW